MKLLKILKQKPFCNDLHYFLFSIILLMLGLKYYPLLIIFFIYLFYIYKKTKLLLYISVLSLIIIAHISILKIIRDNNKSKKYNGYVLDVIDENNYIFQSGIIKIKLYDYNHNLKPGDVLNIEVALNKDYHSEIRAKAVSMIVNPVFGGDVDIFLNDADWRVRRDAIHLGMEEDVLIDIAINDEDDRVRGEALKIIRNERFLHDFALNEDSLQLVFTAIKHMHNEANVRKVYDASDDELIKACARDRLDFLEAGIAIL